MKTLDSTLATLATQPDADEFIIRYAADQMQATAPGAAKLARRAVGGNP